VDADKGDRLRIIGEWRRKESDLALLAGEQGVDRGGELLPSLEEVKFHDEHEA
jgi:hypothetical protein